MKKVVRPPLPDAAQGPRVGFPCKMTKLWQQCPLSVGWLSNSAEPSTAIFDKLTVRFHNDVALWLVLQGETRRKYRKRRFPNLT